ncbi:protein rotatin homolog [Culicoides brevitarsis]|uniref:protein rotatin homolog n=1 Tax=Culicoides brevitarsis TaxID=469753 RepID=UPI00307B2A4A
MKLDDNRDFPDSAIPALQIICKLCIHSPERRRDFSQDIDFNMLLMRAMFMHYHDKDFRSDAATLIFLMAFCDFIVGEDELSVPKALSELFIPFQCEYHDVTSPYDKTSDLEMMFLAEMDDDEQPYDDILFVIDEKTSPKRTKKTTFAPIGSSDEPWQYLRMTFTSLWFGGSEFVLQNVNESEGFRGVVNYKRFPKGLSGSEILDFDPKLEVLEADINLMKITSLPEMIKHQISLIDQAASHEKASKNVACLKSVIFLPHYEEHLPKDLMKVLKRFVVVQPKTDDDEHLFKLVLDLLSHLIKIGYDTILKWALTTLNDHNSTFIRLLHDKRQSLGLFHANIAFVETCIRFFCLTGDAEIQKLLQTDSQGGLVLHIFEIMSEELIKCDKNRVQAQLSLMKTISEFAELETDETFLNKVIGQLFYCLKSLNSLTFSGSYIAKNCLFTIGNVMKLIQQPNLDPNLIKLLQAYCGHKDFVVRAAAWSIFAEICTSQSGAKQVIYELADHLPGGLHACIIQTLLDVEEVSLVKGTAATLFVNLLSFKNERGLVQDVWPRCTKKPIDPKKFDGFELLVQLLNKQRFLELVREQLDRFAPNIYINPEEKMEILTFPDTVIHLANILIAVSDVRPICALTEGEKLTLEAFLRCTYPIVPRNIGSTTLAMVTSVCNLLARYLTHDKKLLDIFVHNSWFVGSMLRLLDLAFYDQEEICARTCTNILHLMQILAQYPVGYELICVSLEQMKPEIIMHFINYNMTGVEKPTLLIDVMNCLTVLTTKHVNNSSSFSSLLDTTSIEDPLSQPSNDGNPVIGLASEVLTKRLIYIFDVVCEQDKPKSGVFHMSELKIATYNCLQALLRYTENAGTIAVDCLLFEKILNRLNTIALDVGMTMRDFIHKYGDRKKKPILQELGLIAGLLSNWYCRVSMLDDMQAEQLLKSLMNVWEWTADGELLLKMMTALMVLSEKSFVVCRGLAVYQSFNHPAFVKRVADIAKNETRKVKGASNLLGVLRVAIRVLINCCSCVEGRIQLHKINVLEIFEHFQPPLMKKNKTMRQMAPLWLEFYEIFSRYLEGSTARHLYLLCTFARKQDANVRIPAMKILRNMAFNLGNRSNLLTSKDYQFLVREKLDSGDIEERIMIISSLWKLVANQWKHKNELKNSAVYIKLNNLSKTLADKFETESDLYKILTCLLDILSS